MRTTAPLPPLTLLPDQPRDWGTTCDLCHQEIAPDTVVRIEDRIGRRHCTRCALELDPSAASAASTLSHWWQSLLGASGARHFSDTAGVLRALADTIDRISQAQIDVHDVLTVINGEPRTHCTVRPEHWTPPWLGWPYADSDGNTGVS